MEKLREKAQKILLKNLKKGFSKNLKKNYFYISPDKEHYHQWFWDSCFHIIVMSEFNTQYAINELETLLSVQKENGFIPHIIFWRFRLKDHFKIWWKKEQDPDYKFFTAEIQPPVIALSLKKLYKKSGDKEMLKKFIFKIEKYYKYLERERDPDRDSLISIITPMESGMDLSPQYDIVLQNFEFNPQKTVKKITEILFFYKKINWDLNIIFEKEIFDVEDVAFNTIYALSLNSLSFLFKEIGEENKSEYYRKKSEEVKDKIIKKFWDEEDKIFYSLYHRNKREEKMKVKTISSLFPLCLDIPEYYVNHLLSHLTDPEKFFLNYPIPSVSKDEKSFGPLTDTRFLWRGTTWVNANWFIYKGLLRHNKKDLANIIKKKTEELIEKFGFCEFYDPLTGYPGKAMRDFSWSTLIVDFKPDE
ncbi:MAG: trehalase family glycosidase [candidate division WOR-3 bacterium]